MKKLHTIAAIILASTLSVMLVIGGTAQGKVTQGDKRPLKTKTLMKLVVAANCGSLKKGLDAGPSSDKEWAALSQKAELLNESGYILMADGRCPDGEWAGAAKTLQGCSAAVVKAIEAKDVDKAKAAFGAMTKACGQCHKAHKK